MEDVRTNDSAPTVAAWRCKHCGELNAIEIYRCRNCLKWQSGDELPSQMPPPSTHGLPDPVLVARLRGLSPLRAAVAYTTFSGMPRPYSRVGAVLLAAEFVVLVFVAEQGHAYVESIVPFVVIYTFVGPIVARRYRADKAFLFSVAAIGIALAAAFAGAMVLAQVFLARGDQSAADLLIHMVDQTADSRAVILVILAGLFVGFLVTCALGNRSKRSKVGEPTE